jgi:N-acetylmuramoyl-L-alanine amidase
MGITSSVFARNRDLKVRSRILRGVYLENSLMLRARSRSRSRHRPFRPKRILFSALVCLLLFLAYNQDSGTSSSSGLSENSVIRPLDFSYTGRYPAGGESAAELKNLQYNSPVPVYRMLGLGVERILIDPGHGGSDMGTSGKWGTLEKDVTLDIAKKMKACLNASGFRHVYMTRVVDTDMSLQDRVEVAKKVKADLFISIHVNWLPNTPVNMIETFYFGPSRDTETLKLADLENQGSTYGLSEFREVLEKLGRNMKLQESRKLAESIQESLFQKTRERNPYIKDHGVKRAPFAVLIGPDVPSVLAEVSCLSNAKEEMALNSENHRRNIAQYLAAGVTNYLRTGALEHESKQ